MEKLLGKRIYFIEYVRLYYILELERSKENEVKIKTLFQQKDNEIKEKQEKISELEKKVIY